MRLFLASLSLDGLPAFLGGARRAAWIPTAADPLEDRDRVRALFAGMLESLGLSLLPCELDRDGDPTLAVRLAASFVPARKPGKLPWKTDRVEYELEYGKDAVEMHVDAIGRGRRVLVVDDLIATGGTAWAACELVKKQGGELVGAAFVVELSFLPGRERLAPVDVFALVRI